MLLSSMKLEFRISKKIKFVFAFLEDKMVETFCLLSCFFNLEWGIGCV